jgi:hypothetical protein
VRRKIVRPDVRLNLYDSSCPPAIWEIVDEPAAEQVRRYVERRPGVEGSRQALGGRWCLHAWKDNRQGGLAGSPLHDDSGDSRLRGVDIVPLPASFPLYRVRAL